MNAKDLELKISGLQKAIEEKTADASRFQDELKTTQKQLEDINKPEITPLQFDLIQEAIERGVDEFDFSDTGNFDIEYGIEYDGKVHCESHELNETYQLVEMITARVHKLFTEAECPDEDIFNKE
eukprot:GHVU01136450.1.p2 GENE.GHVU01136450.1~~GHVU01136450.1.p2  ORF type:complete len:125 (-),score=25.14 GHVU01136450.1:483-857(-)